MRSTLLIDTTIRSISHHDGRDSGIGSSVIGSIWIEFYHRRVIAEMNSNCLGDLDVAFGAMSVVAGSALSTQYNMSTW